MVHRILQEGKRAIGVAHAQGGQVHQARAGGKVILSAGAINSPQLLKLSGIGQSARLAGLGTRPLHDLAEVGENLQDHLQIRTVYLVTGRGG